MPVLTRKALEAIKPENYGNYQSLIRSLKETAIHHQGCDLPDPPVSEPSARDPQRMSVVVVQNADGFIECYSGKWIKVRIVQPGEDEFFADEKLPTYMKMRSHGMPKYSRRPNLSPLQCLLEYYQHELGRLKRRDYVIQRIKEKDTDAEISDEGEQSLGGGELPDSADPPQSPEGTGGGTPGDDHGCSDPDD